MTSRELSNAATTAVLFALIALAVFVRLWGVSFMLPHFTHLDGSILFAQVELFRSGEPTPEANPQWGFYPHLVSHLVALLPDPNAVPLPANATLAQHLARAAAPILQIRWLSTLSTVLMVPGTYVLARLFVARGWALCAAAWIATSTVITSFAQQDRPHGVASTLLLLAVLACVQLRRHGRVRDYLLAGLAVGLAMGALHYGAGALAPLLAAHLLRERGPQRRAWWWGVIALVPIALCVRYFYPFHFYGREGLMQLAGEGDETTLNISDQKIYLGYFNGDGFRLVTSYFSSFDPLLFFACVFALVVWIVRFVQRRRGGASVSSAPSPRRRDAWVVLAFALPYLALICSFRDTAERFLLPIAPFFATFAAWGLATTIGAWASRSTNPARAKLALIAVVAALQVPALAIVLRMDWVRAQPDTFERAADWLVAHAKPHEDTILAMPYLELPLFHRDEELAREPKFSYWEQYEAALPSDAAREPRFDLRLPGKAKETKAEYGDDPLAHMRAIGADYVVVQHVGPNFRYELVPQVRDALRELGPPAARFTPLADDAGDSANNTIRYPQSPLVEPFVVRMLRSRSMGPTIEIYRVPAEGQPAER